MANKTTQQANDKTTAYHLGKMQQIGLKATPKNIAAYLVEVAKSGEMSKRSWHKLRFQFLEQQNRHGYETKFLDWEKIKNDVEGVEWKKPRGGNRKEVKKTTFEAYKECLAGRYGSGVGWAYWVVCGATGCRPAEVLNIETAGTNEIAIYGAKKNKKHKSGLDRFLKLKNPTQFEEVKKALALLKEVNMTPAAIQAKAQQEVFNVCKADNLPKLTLKSLRHQMGTDLKAAGCSPVVIASILGHRATRTQEHYGRTYGNSMTEPQIEVVAVGNDIKDNIRQNPYDPKIKNSTENDGGSGGDIAEKVRSGLLERMNKVMEQGRANNTTTRPKPKS